ncbi:MAG: hypothetical protein RJA70_591 [Pseudomonadota bacterium]|jgi:hypothetical protein
MTKYLFLYKNPPSADAPPPSPEQMQQMFAQWAAWKEKFKTHVIDMGDGLKPGGKVLKGGEVTDGPFAEAKEIIGGFSIVQAASYEEALTVARECPIVFMPGAAIEIREMMGF